MGSQELGIDTGTVDSKGRSGLSRDSTVESVDTEARAGNRKITRSQEKGREVKRPE